MKVCLRGAARLCPALGKIHIPLYQLGRCRRASFKEQLPPSWRELPKLLAPKWGLGLVPNERHHDMLLSLERTFVLPHVGRAAGRAETTAKLCY